MKKASIDATSTAARATPTPIPAFAPVDSPDDASVGVEEFWGELVADVSLAEDVAEDEAKAVVEVGVPIFIPTKARA